MILYQTKMTDLLLEDPETVGHLSKKQDAMP